MEFTKTQPLVDFLLSLGANTIELVRNPKTGKRFFTVPAADTSGRVSEKVEKLSSDLSVSWVIPEDGEPSYMVHPTGNSGNVEDSFSIQG
jgi:hypothetical protein